MKEKQRAVHGISRLERVSRGLFFTVLILFTVLGMLPESKKEYVPIINAAPVFRHTIRSDETKGGTGVTASDYVQEASMPSVSAKGAAVMALETGELIYGKGSDIPLAPASTTKIMTAYTALKSGASLDSPFKVPKEAVGVEGSSIYLREGEQITLRDLLYGLMLESGNDAAEAIAIYCSGTVESFVAEMNRNAAELGLTRTHFDNPHGLYTDSHRTTAYELAVITRHVMAIPEFRKIVGTRSYTVSPDAYGASPRYFSNHNRLLTLFPGAIGVKTGYTLLAGRCLVSCADRGEGSFIAVTLNDRNDWQDHKSLLEAAFSQYQSAVLAERGELCVIYGGRRYVNEEAVAVTVRKGGKGEVELRMMN